MTPQQRTSLRYILDQEDRGICVSIDFRHDDIIIEVIYEFRRTKYTIDPAGHYKVS